MSNKTRVLNVRVVGFSAPERQMLNSIFLLSVAPARQIGYKLWNPEAGLAPDMYLLDGDSDSAVASWQATFASTSDRTLVVGSKNIDLGVASASRPLGLKVVGAMDRLAIALNNTQSRTCTKAPGTTCPHHCRRHAAHGRHGADPETGTDADAPHHRHDLAAASALGQHECHGAHVRRSSPRRRPASTWRASIGCDHDVPACANDDDSSAAARTPPRCPRR